MNSYTVRRHRVYGPGSSRVSWDIVAIVDADHPVAALQVVIGHNWNIHHAPSNGGLRDDPDKDRDRYRAVFCIAGTIVPEDEYPTTDWFRISVTK